MHFLAIVLRILTIVLYVGSKAGEHKVSDIVRSCNFDGGGTFDGGGPAIIPCK